MEIAPRRFESMEDDCAKVAIAITWNGISMDCVVRENFIVEFVYYRAKVW